MSLRYERESSDHDFVASAITGFVDFVILGASLGSFCLKIRGALTYLLSLRSVPWTDCLRFNGMFFLSLILLVETGWWKWMSWSGQFSMVSAIGLWSFVCTTKREVGRGTFKILEVSIQDTFQGLARLLHSSSMHRLQSKRIRNHDVSSCLLSISCLLYTKYSLLLLSHAIMSHLTLCRGTSQVLPAFLSSVHNQAFRRNVLKEKCCCYDSIHSQIDFWI